MSVIEIRGIDHVVLRVRDVERAIRFYCGVLGCREERRVPALGLVQLRAGSALIDLVDVAGALGRLGGGPPGESGRNLDHLALQLRALDESALRAELAAAGIEAGEVAERYGAEGMGPSLYIRDPDGNVRGAQGSRRIFRAAVNRSRRAVSLHSRQGTIRLLPSPADHATPPG
jgi:catechol 2,3-dioxygenase-like lactoylglutathione lyase family enzyme